VIPLESCAVCHDDGSFASAKAVHALDPIEAVSNVAFAVNGADLDVTFDLAADEVAAMNYDSLQRGYRTDGATRTNICGNASFADPCDPAQLTLTNNGGGNYTIKVLGGATIDGVGADTLDNRYLFRVGVGSDRETRVYLWGDFSASPVEDLVISAAACNACHGPEGIDVHGGYFVADDGGEPCLTCHGVGTTPSLMTVVHGYHSGIATWEDPPEETDATFPTYMSNCSVCHAEEAQLAAANAMSVSGEHCFSCHGSIEDPSWKFVDPDPAENLAFHLGFADPETADCSICHDDSFAPATVVAFHNGKNDNLGTNLEDLADAGIFITENDRTFGEPLLDNDGVLWNGADASVTEAVKFDWQITNVADDGTNLAISWTAAYDGDGDGTKEPVDPCNATVGPGAPVFFVDNRIRVYRNYAQGEDFILGPSTTGAGQPGSPVDLSLDNTACADGVATTVIPVETADAATDAERGRVALNGKPLVVSAADPADTMVVRVPTPTFDYLVGIGGVAPDRRNVVDTGKCVGCHVGTLYQHGGDRVDNVDTCLVCHNAAANEQYRRVAMGVDASEAYDGGAGETFEMRTMIHRIHSVNHDWDPNPDAERYNPPYLVYRGRGIYAFSNDVSDVPNWDVISTEGCSETEIARGERLVFGGDPESTSSCQPHNFHSATYPRSLNECTACHTEDFMVIPDQTKSMASTTEAGSEVWQEQLDDVLQGAATTACVTCHADGASKGHAYQNSWAPQAFPEGRQTIIDSVN
jgi:OmcA/MtrC family decaheme c-type cytochrome